MPPDRVRVWVRVRVRIRVGGQFSSGKIVLEPFKVMGDLENEIDYLLYISSMKYFHFDQK